MIAARKTETSAMFLTQDHMNANPKNGQRFPTTTALGMLRARKNYATQAGPSSSTATVLWFLRRVGNVTQKEAKAVVHALVNKYWHGWTLKWLTREFHTKYEAVIPLARHLGKFQK